MNRSHAVGRHTHHPFLQRGDFRALWTGMAGYPCRRSFPVQSDVKRAQWAFFGHGGCVRNAPQGSVTSLFSQGPDFAPIGEISRIEQRWGRELYERVRGANHPVSNTCPNARQKLSCSVHASNGMVAELRYAEGLGRYSAGRWTPLRDTEACTVRAIILNACISTWSSPAENTPSYWMSSSSSRFLSSRIIKSTPSTGLDGLPSCSHRVHASASLLRSSGNLRPLFLM